ncbi:hypothetical protein LEN26_005447 [Aphanomyces euteiches]|nr:hypothetical protein LEN26_005447 [Aphanomyces euteiches]KAH9193528.1 hypothetical protein AeNC1_004501 [Aphanomyces euteiches]
MATKVEVDVLPFYVNLFLLNASDVVQAQIDSKLKKNSVMSFLAGSVAKLAVKDEKVTSQIATQLETQLPQKLAEMGLGVTCKKVFLQGSFVVFECHLQHMELRELILKAQGETFAAHFQALLDAIDNLGLGEAKDNVHAKVTEKVSAALLEKLESVLPEKLGQAGVEVSVVVRTAADQAPFFFDFLTSIAQ